MTSPQNPASAPGPAGFDAQQAGPGRPRPEPPVRGSLGEAPPNAQGGARPAPRPMRFDLRAEFAALTGEPHPFAFWQRAEQLPERFEQEQRRQLQAARPAPDRPKPPAAAASTLFGDLGGSPEPEFSGSLDGELPEPAPRSSGMSGSLAAEGQLAGSLLPEPPLGPPSGSIPQVGPLDGPRAEPGLPDAPPPRREGPPSGPFPAPSRPNDLGLIDGPPPRRESVPDGSPVGPPSGSFGPDGPVPGLIEPMPQAGPDGPPSGAFGQPGPMPGPNELPPIGHDGPPRRHDNQRPRPDGPPPVGPPSGPFGQVGPDGPPPVPGELPSQHDGPPGGA
ncbi:hypothetical protein SAMN05421805_1401, partial [Saccharopolyspora antimicrobica]